MLIQACQLAEDTGTVASVYDMALRCSPTEESHIALERPDTVLLLATMRGGFARRSAYTNALAEQFRQSNGRYDIYDMHSNALSKMKEHHGEDQTPEIRSTLKKKLILSPRVIHSRY